MERRIKNGGCVVETKHVCADCGTTKNVLQYTDTETCETLCMCCGCGSMDPTYVCISPTVYNVRTGETGHVLPSALDAQWVRVVVRATGVTTAWMVGNTLPDWEDMPRDTIGFIEKHITPIWNAYTTLFMHDDASMVYHLACMLTRDQGEAFNDVLLDVLITWNDKSAMHQIVYEYLLDILLSQPQPQP